MHIYQPKLSDHQLASELPQITSNLLLGRFFDPESGMRLATRGFRESKIVHRLGIGAPMGQGQ